MAQITDEDGFRFDADEAWLTDQRLAEIRWAARQQMGPDVDWYKRLGKTADAILAFRFKAGLKGASRG
jgi:hypothetical protein